MGPRAHLEEARDRVAWRVRGLLAPLADRALRVPAAADLPELAAQAAAWRAELEGRILPWWYDHVIDRENGGYTLAWDARFGRRVQREKLLVTQARMVWVFSRAHLGGPAAGGRDYLGAARHGLAFLRERMQDGRGGYVRAVGVHGEPHDSTRRLYDHAFVIFALVEYFRAGRDGAALDEALALFRLLAERAHDAAHGGWHEVFDADWRLQAWATPRGREEAPGYKSANCHMHLLEALSELMAETADPEVGAALDEALRLHHDRFYPPDPEHARWLFAADWGVPAGAGRRRYFGHDVEAPWLMIRAEQVLGRSPTWSHLHAHLDRALRHGADPVTGGLAHFGRPGTPVADRTRVWWVQAELVMALCYGLTDRPGEARYREALRRLAWFIDHRLADRRTGIWLSAVTPRGSPLRTGLAHGWKAGYHDVRAIDTFSRCSAVTSPGLRDG